MPTSATGPSERGFTLVEILVAMVILATLAATIGLTLPDDRLARQQAAVEGWRNQALWAADASLWQARPHAWEIGESEARVLQRRESLWGDAPAPESRRLALPEGLRVTAIESEGEALRPGERLVFSAGEVPPFRIRIESEQGAWSISGDPGGRIEWQRLAGRGKW